eukprot:COSAG01_NODE_37173_length_507_cov_1.276961_1_plen_57_part_00
MTRLEGYTGLWIPGAMMRTSTLMDPAASTAARATAANSEQPQVAMVATTVMAYCAW